MYRAVERRDSHYEGVFFTGVKTTGIFCRPTCRAKRPRPENVEFFRDAQAALSGGYRPCRLCRPMEASGPMPSLVERLHRAVETGTERLTEKDLIALGIEPATARRQFKAYHGMTFQAYQRARRLGQALRGVQQGQSVIMAQLDQGYNSGSGFRGAFARVFGRPPRSVGREQTCLLARRLNTPLGTMLALADDSGLRMLEFEDRRGLAQELVALKLQLHCAIVPGDHAILEETARQVARYFSGTSLNFDVPLAPVGSVFQRQVWEALRTIPPGQTRSYAALAKQLGRAGAARAVGRANGTNMLALVIPCHRVIRGDGTLCGYAGGVWRKQRLLEHERKFMA